MASIPFNLYIYFLECVTLDDGGSALYYVFLSMNKNVLNCSCSVTGTGTKVKKNAKSAVRL